MSTISQVKRNGKKKKFRLDSKFWARVLVIILALSMLASVCYYLIIFTVKSTKVSAAGTSAVDDYTIRVALVYGSSVAVDFMTAADYGFCLGYNDTGNVFHKLAETDAAVLNVACERNLKRSGDRYVLASSASDTEVGAFHLQFDAGENDFEETLAGLKERFPELNFFVSYISGKEYIFGGQFADSDSASALLSEKHKELDDETSVTETEPVTETETDTDAASETETAETSAGTAEDTDVSSETSETAENTETTPVETAEQTETSEEPSPETTAEELPPEPDPVAEVIYAAMVTVPSATAVTVIDPATNKIIFRYDEPSKTGYFGVSAKQVEGEKYSYIKGYKGTTKYTYDYVLECEVYSTDDYYGIKVINVLPLETYVCGVVPYEISNAWPLETQKAFAIAARSYAVALKGHHKSINADICCTTDCQVYKGFGSTNDRVRHAVAETKGLVAVYNGKCVATFYSSSTGGCTANAFEVWNGGSKSKSYMASYGYLVSVATPWEKYRTHSNGTWSPTVTGKDLYTKLKDKGYTKLTGAVTSVKITRLGENNTFVQEVEFSDAKGNKQVVSGYKTVNSIIPGDNGNFVIGTAGKNTTRINYTMLGFGASVGEPTVGVDVKTNPFDVNVTGRQYLSILTANGVKTMLDSNSEYVITAGGTKIFNMSHSLDSQYYPTVLGTNGILLPDISKLTPIIENETVYCDGPSGSFVVVGRGWGHGVGLSQWGIYDMGILGYDYEMMLKSYYSGIEIMSYDEYMGKK